MADCDYCDFKGEVLFDSPLVSAALPKSPAVPGHLVVFPKQHIQILEQASDDVVAALFEAANRLSVAMFEGLKAQGTNIVVMNGLAAGQNVPHLAVHVIPRVSNDGLGFVWPSRKLDDEQMSIVEAQVKENAFSLSLPSPRIEEEAKEELDDEQEDKRDSSEKRRDDIFERQLHRLP